MRLRQLRNRIVPAHDICREITETTAIRNLNHATGLMSTPKAMGCRFALHDFGDGLRAFTYLKHLNVDFLRIHASFVTDMLNDARDCAVVGSIKQIGQLPGLRAVAACLEHQQVFEKLQTLRVDFAQGCCTHAPEPLAAWTTRARTGT